MSTPPQKKTVPTSVNFATAGLGGLIGWAGIHPCNTVAIRMNLATSSAPGAKPVNFVAFTREIIQKEGVLSLYSGLSAGFVRQLFYATSRFGFFEVFRDQMAKYRETDFLSRAIAGVASGGQCLCIFPCFV
jgi:solute carrier family 25 oxoglutarate transporter 11